MNLENIHQKVWSIVFEEYVPNCFSCLNDSKNCNSVNNNLSSKNKNFCRMCLRTNFLTYMFTFSILFSGVSHWSRLRIESAWNMNTLSNKVLTVLKCQRRSEKVLVTQKISQKFRGKNAKIEEREYGFVTQEINNNNNHQWMRG